MKYHAPRRSCDISDAAVTCKNLPTWREVDAAFKRWQERRRMKSTVSFNKRHHS
jgi:hypothetical protein